MGRRLLAFAEAEAMRRGYSEVRLYTNVLMNVLMTENRRLYAAIGYEETGRGTGAGLSGCSCGNGSAGPPTSVALPVQRLLEPYNARDISDFMQGGPTIANAWFKLGTPRLRR